MKTSVSVAVIQPFTWKGQSYRPGQSIDLTPIDAVVLARKHQVTLSKRKAKAIPEPPPPPPVVEPEPEPTPAKRRYKRRDIRAEDIAPVIDIIHHDPEAEP